MELIRAINLSLGYDSHNIIEDLNFVVNEGDYLCIVGENGAGKSTLMKTMLGLHPASGGEIRFTGLSSNEIGYLPQQTLVQRDFPASVYEIVLSGCQARMGRRPFYGKNEKQQALDNMEKLGLSELANRCYRELSGGQQQRVLLARALCATKKLLVLDEPVAGLDPKVTLEMYELIGKLNKEGLTVIQITHDISAAFRYASHILHIGSRIFFGSREEYTESEEGRYFLGRGGEQNG